MHVLSVLLRGLRFQALRMIGRCSLTNTVPMTLEPSTLSAVVIDVLSGAS